MNKISENPFYSIPLELYPLMSTGIPSDDRIGNRSYYDLRIRLETLIKVAMTSKWMFKQSMDGLHTHLILKSLVSQDETERSLCSLHRALEPVVRCIRTLRPRNDTTTPIRPQKSLFRILATALQHRPQDFIKDVNIVASIPRPIYEIGIRKIIPDKLTISICDEEFERRDKGLHLTDCINAVKDPKELNIPSNKKIVRAIRYYTGNFLQLPEQHRSTREYMLAATEYPRSGAETPDIQLSLVQALTPELKTDRELALQFVAQNGFLLEHFPEFHNDEEVVLTAIKKYGNALRYASKNLQDNNKIALAAVQQNGGALKFASETLKSNKEFILEAVQQHYGALRFVHEDLRTDRDVVLAAIQKNGMALQFAPENFRMDRAVVLAMVEKDGMTLQFAHDDLKKDPTIVLAAVQQNGRALQFAHEDLKKDPAIVLAAVQQNGRALEFASDALKDDKKVVLAAIQQDVVAFQFASEVLRNGKDLNRNAIEQNGQAPFDDKYITAAAILFDGQILRFGSATLLNDKQIILDMVEKNGLVLEHASEELRNDKDVVRDAVENNYLAARYIGNALVDDKDFLLELMDKHPSCIPVLEERQPHVRNLHGNDGV